MKEPSDRELLESAGYSSYLDQMTDADLLAATAPKLVPPSLQKFEPAPEPIPEPVLGQVPEQAPAQVPAQAPGQVSEQASEPRGEFSKGWERGTSELGALAYGAGGALASLARDVVPDAIEPEFLKNTEEEWLKEYTDRMQQVEEDKSLTAAVPGIEDIRLTEEGGFSRLGDWAAGQLGEGLPTILTSVVGGGVGAIGGKALVSAGVKSVAKGAVEKVAASQAAKQAAVLTGEELAALATTNTAVNVGAAVGAGAVNLGMETGGIFGDIYERTGEKHAGTALAFGSIAAALDTALPFRILKELGAGALMKKGVGETLARNPTYWKRLLAEVPKAAAIEGSTEGLQELIEEAAVQWVDENSQFLNFSKETYLQALNAGASGLLLGGAFAPISAQRHGGQNFDGSAAKLSSEEAASAQVASEQISPEQVSQAQDVSGQITPEQVVHEQIVPAQVVVGQTAPEQVAPEQGSIEPTLATPVPTEQVPTEVNPTLAEQGLPTVEPNLPAIEPSPVPQQIENVPPDFVQSSQVEDTRPGEIPQFRSALEEAVSNTAQKRASGGHWLNLLKAASGVKKEEIEDTGLESWLQEQESVAVPKEKILDFLKQNHPRIEEVTLQSINESSPESTEVEQIYKRGPLYEKESSLRTSGPSKNYKEFILTLPGSQPFTGEDTTHFGEKTNQRDLAWVRGDERTDTEGKTGFLIDEIQSKRHQEGRKLGYVSGKKIEESGIEKLSVVPDESSIRINENFQESLDVVKNFAPNIDIDGLIIQYRNGEIPFTEFEKQIPLMPRGIDYFKRDLYTYSRDSILSKIEEGTDREINYNYSIPNRNFSGTITYPVARPLAEIQEELSDRYMNQLEMKNSVPDAPFKKSWPLLMTKKVIQKAAADGLDRIYWTLGQTQSDRYQGYGEEALKRFYDQELPREIGAYVKKFGGRVFQTQLDVGEGKTQAVWAIDITPALRKEVLETGATLYSKNQASPANQASEAQTKSSDISLEDSTRAVRGQLVSHFGESVISRLERAGILNYEEDQSGHGYSGLYSRGKKSVTLFPSTIIQEKEDPVGVLLHEGGSHAYIPTMLGRSMPALQKSFDKLLSEGSETAFAAQKRAEDSSLRLEHIEEERIAYFIQEAWDRIQNRQDIGPANALFRRIINAIKAWFRTTEFGKYLSNQGINFELTDDYAVALATRAINELSQTASPQSSSSSSEVLATYGGRRAIERLAGKEDPQATEMKSALERASHLYLVEKKKPVEIWKETGWFMDEQDKEMRFRISDVNAKLLQPDPEIVLDNGDQLYRLGKILDHEELYRYYPQLWNLVVRVTDEMPSEEAVTHHFKDQPSSLDFGKNAISKKSTILHEVQHVVQHIEGFAMGGSSASVDLLDKIAQEKVERHVSNPKALELQQMFLEFKENLSTIETLNETKRDLQLIVRTSVAENNKETALSANKQLRNVKEELAAYQKRFGYLFYLLLHGEAEARETEALSALPENLQQKTPPRVLLGGSFGIVPGKKRLNESYLQVSPENTIVTKYPRATWSENIDSWQQAQEKQSSRAGREQAAFDESLREDVLASRPLRGSSFLHPIDFVLGHDSTDLSWFERFRIWQQDAFHALWTRQEDTEKKSGAPIPPHARAYQAVSAFHNISTERIKALRKDFQEKILDIAQKAKISIETMDKFLYARSAPEANDILERRRAKEMLRLLLADNNVAKADVARIKREMTAARTNARYQGQNGKWYIRRRQLQADYLKILDNNLQLASPELIKDITEFREKPSGMATGDITTPDTAAFIMNEFSKTPEFQALQDIGAKIDEMNRFVVDQLVNSQLLSKSQAVAWNNYQHYVMLRRHGYEDSVPGSGRGFSSSRPSPVRYGSTREAVDILTNTFAGAEAQIIKAEKNLVGLSLAGLVNSAPDKHFWTIVKARRSAFLDENGFVSFGETKTKQDTDVAFWLKGKPHLISFNPVNKRAESIARAFNRLDASRIRGPLLAMRAFNRFLGLVSTSLSPEFLLTNLPRDFLTAQFNLGASEAHKIRGKMTSNYLESFKALRLLMRTDVTSTANPTNPLVQDVIRFQKAGGVMDWASAYRTTEQHKAALERRLKELTPGTMHYYKRNIASFIEDYNSIAENMTRFAAFRALTAPKADGGLGISDAEAVDITNELTTHFSRKGTAGEATNALFLFANASIQGSTIILTNLAKSPRVRKYVYAAVVSSILIDLLNRALSAEDDDGRNLYNQIPDNVKGRNMVFVIPGTGRPITVPAPWGYNVFWLIGQKVGEMISSTTGISGGKKDFSYAEAASSIFSTALTSFSPISAGSIAQAVTPTMLDPLVMIGENKNAFGSPLYPEKFPTQPKPDSQLYWSSTSTVSRTVSEFLNSISGGDKVASGAIDVSPATLDLWATSLFGAVGKQISLLTDLSTKIASGRTDEIESSDIPLVRRILPSTKNTMDPMRYHQNVANVLTLKAQIKEYRGKDPEYITQLLEKNAGLRRMFYMTTSTEERLSQLRKLKKRAIDNEDREREKLLDERIKELQIRYNNIFNERVNSK